MMRFWTELRERVRALGSRRVVEREMEDEFAFHLAMEEESHRRAGLSPEEAVRRARLDFGGVERMKEEVRDARGVRLLEELGADLRLTTRRLGAQRGFTLVVVLTLALGIGATSLVYGLLRAVVLAPLPYPAPERLMVVEELTPDGSRFSMSLPNYRDFRAQQRSFSQFAAAADRDVALLGTGEPLPLHAQAVTADFLPMFGVRPALGRWMRPDEQARGERVVVISHGLWTQRLGASRDVLRSSISLDGNPYTVVGVMPRAFQTPGEPALWLPLPWDPHAEREDHGLTVFARLAPGAALATALGDLAAIATSLGERYPETNGGWSANVSPLRDRLVGETWPRAAWILMGAVALLLLLTCVNVASLLLARSLERGRELSLRVALGASRGRLVRQLLTESLVLSTLGAAAGVALATVALPAVRAVLPADTPRLADVRVEPSVLLLATGLAMVVGLLFGLAPAVRAARTRPREALADGARGERPGAGRVREALVACEIALATVLLVGAALLGTSYLRLQAVDTGMAAERTLVVPLTLPGSRYEGDGVQRVVGELEERLRGLPGVTAVGTSNVTPFGEWGTATHLAAEGQPSGPGETTFARWRAVTPGFFEAAGVTLRRGRLLDERDYAADAPERVVVTETFARRFFPGRDALGGRVAMGVNGTNWREIVGIVADVRDLDVQEETAPLFFLPGLGGWPNVTLLVRTTGDPAALVTPVRETVWSVDPDLPVAAAEPLAERLRRSIAGPRFHLQVMAGFATVALLLAALGIYGTMAYGVARRTKEFGIRLALGAGAREIRRLVLRRGLAIAGAGLAVGMAGAVALSRVLGAILFDAGGLEPATLGAVALLLGAVALLAALVPARRATRASALQSLRVDG